MSYLVLARKSRPQSFEEVVGQQPVVRTLRNALAQNRVAHAMIFSGVRGTGKTTLARIMAKALNCEHGPTPTPCNACRSCVAIRDGNSVDLQEVDGASNRGIQEIRELKEKIRFLPSSSRFKVIIIDEVHMLTTEAFNALLKTLEEPPEHVYFLFATTELHKVPVTILSRCQRYELKKVSRQELFHHFQALAVSEGVTMDERALHLVVREAGGSVRDGLSLLDQVFSYCGTRVTAEDVTEVLGLVSQEVIAGMVEALLQGNLEGALAGLDQVYGFGMDHKRFMNEMLDWLRNLLVVRISRQPEVLLDLPEEEMELLRTAGQRYSAQTLMQMFCLLLEPFEKAGFSSRPRFQIEMAFIRAVQAGEVVSVPELLTRLEGVLQGVPLDSLRPFRSALPLPASARLEKLTPLASPVQEPASNSDIPVFSHQPVVKPATVPEPAGPLESSGPPDLPEFMGQPPGPEPSPVALPSTDTLTPFAGSAVADKILPVVQRQPKDIRQHWDEFLHYVRDRKPWMASALQRSREAHFEDDKLIVRYEDPVDCRLLKSKENVKSLTEYALDFFQGSFTVVFQVPQGDDCATDVDAGDRPRRERQALAGEKLVLAALDIFNGQIGDIRVGPRFRVSLVAEPEEQQDWEQQEG